jgi:hypothetical protein
MKKLLLLFILTGCMSKNSSNSLSYVCSEETITTVYRINHEDCPTNSGILYSEGVDINCDSVVDIDEVYFAALYCDPSPEDPEPESPKPPKKVKDKKHGHEDCDHMHGRHNY